MEDVTSDDELFFLFLNLSAVPKKSTPGKFPYIRNFQQIGINTTKLEKRQFILKVTFSMPSPLSMLKVPIFDRWPAFTREICISEVMFSKKVSFIRSNYKSPRYAAIKLT